ncbi:MAG: tetratricopeptide repeat protein [Gammaproteobacteria bacterium]
MARVLGGLLPAILVAACASSSVQRPITVPAPTSKLVTEVVPPGSERVVLNVGNLVSEDVRPPDNFHAESDPLFQILVAEFAGQRGRLDIAAESYAAAALQLQDLDVAKRATRIAVFSRNNQAALQSAKIWVAQAPKDIEARQILAAMHIRSGEVEAAITQLETVLNAGTQASIRHLGTIANLLSREEDKLTALKVMERLIDKRDNDADAQLAYALLAIRAEEIERANKAMERVLESDIGNSNIAMAYVGLLQKNSKSLTAFNWLERAIKKSPNDTGLRLIYARLLADSNRYEEARLQFALVADKTPDNSDVVYALGLLNLQANRIDEARDNFSRLLKLRARDDDANFYLGQIAESRQELGRAIELYGKVTSGSNHFQAQVRIALILSLQNEISPAQAQLHAIEVQNEEQRFQLVRAEGEILTQHNRHEEAMAVYDRALEASYDMELLYTRAMLAEKLDRFDVLEADLQTIIEREPDNAQALNALGYTLADRTDRYDEAYEFVRRALILNPEDFYILDSMGWVLYRLGRLNEAVEYLTKAREIKDDPEVAAHLGEVLWVMGDKQAARDIWDSALKDTPDDQRLLDVIQRLAP